MTIFTIGYEGLTIDAFIALLTEHAVETLVDVRELPLSRKRGFSKKALADSVNNSGIAYVHIAALGCPRPVRNQYREDKDWQRYTEGFLAHLQTQQTAITELADLTATSTCALLCYEADFNFCHRTMVADAVSKQRGTTVRHIGAYNPSNSLFSS